MGVVLGLPAVLALACADDGSSEHRPTEDDLNALFEHLCTLREQCRQSWGANDAVEACTQGNVDEYKERPTARLDQVVEYYECVNQLGEESCVRFVQHVPPLECIDQEAAAITVCPADTRF